MIRRNVNLNKKKHMQVKKYKHLFEINGFCCLSFQ